MSKVFIAGATGGIGSAIVFELIKQNFEVIAFARNKNRLNEMFGGHTLVTCIAGDVLDEEQLLQAAQDADLIIHAVNFPYQDWNKTHIQCLQNLLAAAKQQDARFIMIDNIYAYSKSEVPLTEYSEKSPPSKKGELRLHMEQLIKASGLPYMILHIPDVYGPRAAGTHIGVTLDGVVKKKVAYYVGPMHVKREFAYTGDVAQFVVELSKRPDCYMQNWNLPGGLHITGQQLEDYIKHHTGYEKSFKPVTSLMLFFVGLFDPFMREMREMFYLCEEPLFIDGSKLKKELGELKFTNIEQSLLETYAWMKSTVNN